MERIIAGPAGPELAKEASANAKALAGNPYPGRGIVVGADAGGKNLVQVYWIMGRSANSRNRIFRELGSGTVRTEAFDPSLLTDPSLIIYTVARRSGSAWIVTNGDQTDTIGNALDSGSDFESALETREFEPDAPNYTSRISAVTDLSDPRYAFRLSILRRGVSGGCDRFSWRFSGAQAGIGRFISTYSGDGNPLPAFCGEPLALPIPAGGAREIAAGFWALLNPENRVSIMARTIGPGQGEAETFIINGKENR
jgi:hypothetical protein